MGNVLKDQEVNLNEIDPGLKRIKVGLGWDAPSEADGFPVDLDASAFLLKADGVVRQDTDFVFYNNLQTEEGKVRHLGDCHDGEIEGDDEEIEIDLEAISFDIDKITFSVTIHNYEERQQSFGLIKNAYMRVVDLDTNYEIARFDLTEDASDENGFIFGEIFRDVPSGWKFKALGVGCTGGLYQIARDFNVNVSPM